VGALGVVQFFNETAFLLLFSSGIQYTGKQSWAISGLTQAYNGTINYCTVSEQRLAQSDGSGSL
jgi:hypothetical protein